MKPIKTDEFVQTINMILQHFSKYKTNSDKRLKVLVENYGDERIIKKIVIPNTKGFDVIALEDIIRLEGDRNYTNFVTHEKSKISSTKTLVEYEALLSEYGFLEFTKAPSLIYDM